MKGDGGEELQALHRTKPQIPVLFLQVGIICSEAEIETLSLSVSDFILK